MSLVPKLDKLRVHENQFSSDLVMITKTWLCDSILDEIIDISGYCVIRKDHSKSAHGGVCIFVKDNIHFIVLD